MNVRKWGFVILGVCLLSLAAGPVLAGETMDKIEKTGKMKVGFREDSIPFASIDPKVGKQVGFSVDMANILAENLSTYFAVFWAISCKITCISSSIDEIISIGRYRPTWPSGLIWKMI